MSSTTRWILILAAIACAGAAFYYLSHKEQITQKDSGKYFWTIARNSNEQSLIVLTHPGIISFSPSLRSLIIHICFCFGSKTLHLIAVLGSSLRQLTRRQKNDHYCWLPVDFTQWCSQIISGQSYVF